jgi:lysophospholipase L1-like esterase
MKRSSRLGICAALSLLWAPLGFAQGADGAAPAEAPPVGIVAHPCPPAIEPPASMRALLVELFIQPRKLLPTDMDRLLQDPQFKTFEAANRRLAVRDWAGLCRFRDANAQVIATKAPVRVVFMGDSITENWLAADPKLFEHGVVNRGISGQTTAQMLVRFRADVVALNPKVVHIMAGTNDVAGNTGPTSPEDFQNNIMAMAEIARANGIGVVLAAIPPTASFNWQPKLKPVPTIQALNAWLKAYAGRQKMTYIDYYALLTGPQGEFPAALSNDGVHPNSAGYGLMRARVVNQVPGVGP